MPASRGDQDAASSPSRFSVATYRKLDKQRRPLSDGARHIHRSPERIDAVGKAYEPGAVCGIGPSGAIVTDRELKDIVPRVHGDAHRGSVRVLGGIRERF
jgi:hypothetical protein